MKLRKLNKLKDLPISKKFATDNNFKIYIFEKGDFVFYNECFLIHVYAFTVEDIPYIDLYLIGVDDVLYSNIDRLLQKSNLGTETKMMYENIKNDYLTPVSWDGESNLANCLKIEQNYVTYLSVMSFYLPKLFHCNSVLNVSDTFDLMSKESKMKFENLVNDLKEWNVKIIR